MDSFSVKVGDSVKKGQKIGVSGNRTDMPEHLHFELRKNVQKLNPLDFLPENLIEKDNVLYKKGKND